MSAVESDFICNLNTCRRQVVNTGWVTSCSHMFCEEDGQEKLRLDSPIKCPVCETLLQSKYDVVHVNLNPSEEYKSMVLAGMRPEVIMEIAGRAVSFWAYQMYSERSYQERSARKVAARIEHVQSTTEASITTLKTELSKCHRKIEDLGKENEALHLKVHELREAIADRGRQLHKTQTALSLLRRGNINKSSESPSSIGLTGVSPSKASSIGSPPEDLFSMEQSRHNSSLTPNSCSSDQGFAFRPQKFPNSEGRSTIPPFTSTNK